MSDAPIAANPERGEVDLVVNGRTYVLKLSMNAAVTLESRLKTPIGKVLERADQFDFTAIRDVMFVLLQKYHAAEFRTPESVGDLMDEAGSVAVFFHAMERLGKANKETAGGTGANPLETQAGTGGASLSAH